MKWKSFHRSRASSRTHMGERVKGNRKNRVTFYGYRSLITCSIFIFIHICNEREIKGDTRYVRASGELPHDIKSLFVSISVMCRSRSYWKCLKTFNLIINQKWFERFFKKIHISISLLLDVNEWKNGLRLWLAACASISADWFIFFNSCVEDVGSKKY